MSIISSMKEEMKKRLDKLKKYSTSYDGRIPLRFLTEFLNISVKRLYAIRDTENAPPYYTFGKRLYFYIEDLYEWVESKKRNRIKE